jgi:acyl dehydratase
VRFFEDYAPGSVHELGSVSVSESEIVEFARRYDAQPFHVDAAAAAAGPFGGLVASGWHTAAMMMTLLVERFLDRATSLGSPGLDELRWPAPVRPGDTLTVRVTVMDARPSTSKPDRGLVRSHIEARNGRGETVMTVKVMNLVRRRPPA